MKINKFFKVLLSLVAIYAILGFFILPLVLKPQLEKAINNNITKQAKVGKIQFNPFTLEFKLKNFSISNKNEQIISFDEFYVDFSMLKSIDKRHIRFENIVLKNANINIIEDEKGVINLTTIAKQTKQSPKEDEKTSSKSLDFLILKTAIENATITYKKLSKIDPFSISLNKLNYTFYDLGSFKNSLASHKLETYINDSTKLFIKGGFKLTPFSMYANVKLENLKPTEFISYKKSILNFEMDKKASLNLDFGYQLSMNKDLDLKVQNLNLDINDINLLQKQKTIIALKNLALKNLNLQYPKQEISIQSLSSKDFYTNIIKNKTLNLNTLVKNEKALQEKSSQEKTSNNPKKTKAWIINLEKLNFVNSSLNYNDLNSKDFVSIKNLDFDISKVNINNENINLDFARLQKPAISYKNEKNKIDLKTNLYMKLSNFSKKQDDIFINDLLIKNDFLNLQDNKSKKYIDIKNMLLDISHVNYDMKKASIEKITFDKKRLDFFDKVSKNKFQTKNINLSVNKLDFENKLLKIKSFDLTKPYISVTLPKQTNKETTKIKKQKVVKKSVKNTKKEESNFDFEIGPFKIHKASLDFEDKNLPISYKSKIRELDGEFSELSSTSSKPTKLKVEGRVDKYGYTKITGLLQHEDIKELTDINMIFKNIAIKNFTPYTGKFIGREMASGKLDLNLKYNIKKSSLDAKNSIIIKKIKFGKNVKSKEAVSLPLDLAIALLEDKNGIIDLDIPLSGNVDDPKFAIAPIAWQAFTNLIVKAVSSPFSLLASVLGIESKDIKNIEFEYGRSTIIASEKEVLDNIAKILEKRPKLSIKITPSFHKENDTKKLKELKAKELVDKKMQSIKDTKIDKYQVSLENIYNSYKPTKTLKQIKAVSIIKTKEKQEFSKEKYLNNLYEFISNKQKISKNEEILLTKNRVKSIKEYLTNKKVNLSQIEINSTKDTKNKGYTTFDLGVDVLK